MGRPGRPRGNPYKNRTFNLSEEVIKLIQEYGDAHNVPYKRIIEEAVLAVFKGKDDRILSLTAKLENVGQELKSLKDEKERLEKENEHLKKKVAKLEIELEKWREKWGGQKTLTKWSRKTKEIKELVEQLIPHIEEGLTWREVLVKLGILDLGDRMDILHKLYKPVVTRFGKKEGYLVSQYIKD